MIKRFLLRALMRAAGAPLTWSGLSQAAKDALSPRPLASDIDQARNELEAQGFIVGTRDLLDDSDGAVVWGLTPKGELQAKRLG